MSFPVGNSWRPSPGGRSKSDNQSKSAMRHQLKAKTPSAAARLSYITRRGRYAVGLDGPRDDLRATGSANLPGWARGDAAVFWSAVDGFERANARRCLELELNLPRELTTRQQIAAVEDYIARLTAEAGPLPMSWAIHNSGDGNPHAHIMIQERPLDGRERTAETWFKRANRQQPEKGGALKSQWWHDRENVFWSRALWADACNQALIASGHAARFDARSKTVRFDEALERGQWLDAVLLSTITERHEGVAVAGMRRRLERGECWLEDLPDYAQRLIAYNDGARAHNCALRDWARTATEAELLAYLAPELEHRNPSAHVAAWEAAQQVQAFDEDRQRAVALAVAAGELELLTTAQIEAGERARLAAELGELIALERGDQLDALLVIEVEQAHGAALAEDAQRVEDAALDALLHGLHTLCDAMDELRERDPAAEPAVRAALDAADRLLALPPPSPVLRARLDDLERGYALMCAEAQRRAEQADARRRAELAAQAQRAAAEQAEAHHRASAEAQRQQVIEHARSGYRAADRRVVEAVAALQRAQGTLEYQQRRLAEVPALQKQRNALAIQANERAAAVKRLRAERAAWLADHPVRSRAGLTGPADALRQQEANHLDAYHQLFAQAEQISSRIRSAQPAVEQAQRAVEAAQTALREAESRADQRFDDAGGPDAALRRAGLAQPAPLRERFVQGLQQMEQRLDELDDDGPTITPPGGPRFRY